MSHHKRQFVWTVLIAALVVTVFLPTSISAQAAPATPSTGTRIGTIIKDTISTAFPGVSGIGGLIDAIWAKKPTNGNSVNKAQLTTAATQAQPDINKNVVAQAQQHLASISQVVDELSVLSQFGVPTTTAMVDVVRMLDLVSAGKPLSPNDLTSMKGNWAEAKAELATVKNADPTKVQDLWLRDKLVKIQQANNTVVLRIDTEIAAKPLNSQQLATYLNQLNATLQDISAAMGYEVSNMQADLKSLSSWANGAAGDEEVKLTPEGLKYKAFLDKQYQ
ncbi:MAG TPA: hypothetical protein VK788_09085 [Terriglobales bacterium]|jgi:hypothetical protein|nr:hypothetical protein [Terriglobales bacterium]